MAQVRHRSRGWPNSLTQPSQTALLGQAWQIAQRLGSHLSHSLIPAKTMLPIYCRRARKPGVARPQAPSMSTQRPPTIDPAAARRWAGLPVLPTQQPPGFASPWLHEEVARRMEDRLQWLVQKPAHWAHWEPVRGGWQAQELLQTRYPRARVSLMEADPTRAALLRRAVAAPWWNPLARAAGMVRVESPARPVGMLWANMALHHADDPQALMAQWLQLLEVDGFLMFSCLGPDTLRELRAVYAAQGWPPPCHAFTDMHDWGDMLVAAGFAEPVMDMERITLSYSAPEHLLAELRTLGRNLSNLRAQGLRTGAWRERLLAVLRQDLADPSHGGRLTVSFEVIYGHAFKLAPRFTAKPQTNIAFDSLRQALRRGPQGPEE